MKPKRRKIHLDRGDTLGGTVPLLLSDSVTANGTGGRFLHKDKGSGAGWWLLMFVLIAAIAGSVSVWLLFPETVEFLGLPTAEDLSARLFGADS